MLNTGETVEVVDENNDSEFEEDDEPNVVVIPGNKPMAILHPVLFFTRRILFAVSLIWLRQYIVFQMMLYIFPTLAVIIAVGWYKPMYNSFLNELELYNNCSIIFIAYCLLYLTDFMPSPLHHNVIGIILAVFTFQTIFINLYLIAVSPVRLII